MKPYDKIALIGIPLIAVGFYLDNGYMKNLLLYAGGALFTIAWIWLTFFDSKDED